MKEVTKKLYEYSELSEEAQERARNNTLDGGTIGDEYWDYVLDNQGGLRITKDEMKLLSGLLSNDDSVIETGNGDGSYCTFFGTVMDNKDIVSRYNLSYNDHNIVFAIEDDNKGSLEKLEARIIETYLDAAMGVVDDGYLEELFENNNYWFDINGKQETN